MNVPRTIVPDSSGSARISGIVKFRQTHFDELFKCQLILDVPEYDKKDEISQI